MRIMWMSNAPWSNTGYGRQTRETTMRLRDLGHDVAICANFGLSGASINWRGIPVYPAYREQHCTDVLPFYIEHFDADILITLYDVWSLPIHFGRRVPCPWVALTPVDGSNVSDNMKKRLDHADYVVAYSRHGHNCLMSAGYEAHYIPHGIDTSVFCPGDKAESRGILEFPDDVFLTTIVAVNKGYPPRKAWVQSFRAYKIFKRIYDAKSMLYCHTTRTPLYSNGEGIYLPELERELDLVGQVIYSDERATAIGVPDETMAHIYRASDVVLNATMGEGFGLPVLEAQACGTPVITQNCTAMTELTENGIAIEPDSMLWLPTLGYWWYVPGQHRIVEALIGVSEWYRSSKMVPKSARGVRMAQKDYDWSVVMAKYWEPFLTRIQEEMW